MRGLALAVRFVLELCAFGALAVWGWQVAGALPAQLLLSILAPAAAIVVWGAFVAPRARYPVPDPLWLAIEALVFLAAALALVGIGDPWGALALAVVYVLDVAALAALGERRRVNPEAPPPGGSAASDPPPPPSA